MEEEEVDDNNNQSYTGSNQSDISLGSDDTKIEEEELADIQADATMPPTPKKPAISAKKAASAKKQKDPVLELDTELSWKCRRRVTSPTPPK